MTKTIETQTPFKRIVEEFEVIVTYVGDQTVPKKFNTPSKNFVRSLLEKALESPVVETFLMKKVNQPPAETLRSRGISPMLGVCSGPERPDPSDLRTSPSPQARMSCKGG